jgi:gamma-glutamylcyclotransferase (GGCT)/AIG2-like uncharacterized protein YtfP
MSEESDTGEPVRIVVYGTLMQGQSNSHYLASARFLGQDILYTIVLYDLGLYPAARFETSAGIGVEVYEIDNELLASLDVLEELSENHLDSGLYVRRLCDTAYGLAWIYLYNRDTSGCKSTTAGLWKPQECSRSRAGA